MDDAFRLIGAPFRFVKGLFFRSADDAAEVFGSAAAARRLHEQLEFEFAGDYTISPGGDLAGKVRFVEENPGIMSEAARDFQAGAIGSQSNRHTRNLLVPQIDLVLPDGSVRGVKFDSISNGVLLDRKLSVTSHANSINQALAQSEALRQNKLIALWEVPGEVQAKEARGLLDKLGIQNIFVRVAE